MTQCVSTANAVARDCGKMAQNAFAALEKNRPLAELRHFSYIMGVARWLFRRIIEFAISNDFCPLKDPI